MKTRDRIIDTAITLFNAKGSRSVSTNHIAKAAGISPGNLYYHFRNKEEIIRAILDKMDALGQEQFLGITETPPSNALEVFEQTFSFIQEFNRKFLFFKRELPILVMNDPTLKERFKNTHQTTLAMIRANVDSAVEQGVMKTLNEKDRGLLSEMAWMITLFWLNYLEVAGEETSDNNLKKGIDVIRLLVKSFLAETSLMDDTVNSEPTPN